MEVDRAARGNGPTSSPSQGVIEAAETAVRSVEAKENLHAAETKDETRDLIDAAVKGAKAEPETSCTSVKVAGRRLRRGHEQ
jgi:hypothetical protein